jgi:murein DD-endopeptidase MepM/ murein hydrolase activator NlpD
MRSIIAVMGLVALSAEAVPASLDAHYILPFRPGEAHALVQGFDGPHGHSGVNAYAYDFSADIGTEIVATRAGVVVHVVESNADAQPRHPEPGHENVIVIDHGDGTFGRYYHLTRNGADVAVGARVMAGQMIGRTGNSGATFMPHLHFDVVRRCFEYGCQTVPFRFAGQPDRLNPGEAYSR